MSYYGYNPADFKTDFSWLGDIGAAVSKSAHVMPELWKLNQEIKENKFLKEKTYKEMTDWVDKFSDEEANAVAASMGLEYTNPMEAKAQLKQRMLNPSTLGEITNEEYIKRFATESIVPLYNAVSSEKNPNPNVDMGRLLARIPSGTVQEAFGGTSAGKSMNEQAAYDKSFNRRFGSGGEMETELGIRNQSQLDGRKMEDEYNQQKAGPLTEAMGLISSTYDKSKKPFDNYKSMKKAAIDYAKMNEFDDNQRAMLLQEVDKEYQYLQEQANKDADLQLKREKERNDKLEADRKALQTKRDKTDPLVDQTDINNLYKDQEARIKQIDNRILMLRDDLATNKVKDKKATENLIKSLESERDYLSSYLQDKDQLESKFQQATGLRGEDSRQSVLNREAFKTQQEGNLRRNKLMIDNSRDKITAANTKFSTNPNKLFEVLNNDVKQEKDLYQVVKVGDKYKISLKKDYKGLQKYLDNPNANVTVEDMIGKDVYQSKVKSFNDEEKSNEVDWAKVRRAKEVLATPDSPDKPDLPRMKENAKKYLESVYESLGVQY